MCDLNKVRENVWTFLFHAILRQIQHDDRDNFMIDFQGIKFCYLFNLIPYILWESRHDIRNWHGTHYTCDFHHKILCNVQASLLICHIHTGMQHFLVILYLPKAFYNDEFVCYNIRRTVHLLNHPKAQTVKLGGIDHESHPPFPTPPATTTTSTNNVCMVWSSQALNIIY